MNLERIFIDKDCLVLSFDTGFEYDPSLWDTKQEWWLDHMREKIWFTKEIEEQVVKFLGQSI